MSKFRDYENYEIYEDGRIWSYKRKKFLKPQTDTSGYKFVKLSDNEGKAKFYRLHRVVWVAVKGEEIPENLECNHIDEDKDNCKFENLNLLTHKQNCNWKTRTERASKAQSKQVGAFKNGKLVMTFNSTREAQRQGFSSGNISACCRNCYKRDGNNVYRGYGWRYI